MPLRCFQVLRLITPIPFALAALYFAPHETARAIGAKALVGVVALGVAGALLGLVFLFTGVRLRCPFCRRWGPGAVERNGRPWMECATCGTIRCAGFLGLKIVRE